MDELMKVEERKIDSLTLIDDKRKELIKACAPMFVIPYMPITQQFIQEIILNDTEYPLLESKLSQAATEMKTRFNSIVDAEYNYQKNMIEIEKLQLDIEEISENKEYSEKRKEVLIREKNLEISMKSYQAASIKANTDYTYNEFAHWCRTTQDYVEILKQVDPNVKSFEDVNFDAIRITEISVKIQRWAEMEKNGVELNPSQKNLVDSYKHAKAEHEKMIAAQKTAGHLPPKQ